MGRIYFRMREEACIAAAGGKTGVSYGMSRVDERQDLSGQDKLTHSLMMAQSLWPGCLLRFVSQPSPMSFPGIKIRLSYHSISTGRSAHLYREESNWNPRRNVGLT